MSKAWNDFTALPEFTRPVDKKEAAILTRRIIQLDEFRAKVDAGTAYSMLYTVDDATNEALRREYILRLDIQRFLTERKLPADDPFIAAVKQELDDNGGHRR